uniref:Uncharacterized protein n=1 Tax=viral metagenome TaxID=1070528 RepID=A0A6C0EC83_9ZZZZ
MATEKEEHNYNKKIVKYPSGNFIIFLFTI